MTRRPIMVRGEQLAPPSPERVASASTLSAAPDDAVIAEAILRLCAERGVAKTICPSEVARALAADEAAWRALMPGVRRVAADLAAAGRIAVTQRGLPVDPMSARGAIRLSRQQPRHGRSRAR